MASVSIKNAGKTYPGGVNAVREFNLEIAHGEFIILVGPSGCGKSTMLRMIAGLESIDGGEVFIGDRLVNRVPAKDRDIAMVFQDYALYPHMNVEQNLSFALRTRRVPRPQIRERVREVAAQLEMDDLLLRKPAALSGGQRQRVALGRAMMRDPAVFLFDEPLSNLDARLRTAMRAEILRLHKRLGATFIYVTHDQTEAMTMADRIVVMRDGLIQQAAPPAEIYRRPANRFVAEFIGSPQMNLLPVRLVQGDASLWARLEDTLLPLPQPCPGLDSRTGEELLLGVRPEAFALAEEAAPGRLEAEMELAELLGSEMHLHLRAGDRPLVVRAPAGDFAPGERLWLAPNPGRLHLFDPETGARVYPA